MFPPTLEIKAIHPPLPSPDDPELLRELHVCQEYFSEEWIQEITRTLQQSLAAPAVRSNRKERPVQVGVAYGGMEPVGQLRATHAGELSTYFDSCINGSKNRMTSPNNSIPDLPDMVVSETPPPLVPKPDKFIAQLSLAKVASRELRELLSHGELCYKVHQNPVPPKITAPHTTLSLPPRAHKHMHAHTHTYTHTHIHTRVHECTLDCLQVRTYWQHGKLISLTPQRIMRLALPAFSLVQTNQSQSSGRGTESLVLNQDLSFVLGQVGRKIMV